MASLLTLIEACEWVDRREREAEHGYAACHVPSSFDLMETNIKKSKQLKNKTQGNRTTHNELEKNRRAHLRGCLEQLKNMVPLNGDSSRHTTLGLLNKAKSFIRNLEDRDRKHRLQKEQLAREQRFLLRKLDQLSESYRETHTHRIRSISESSSGISSASTSPTSEDGEYDLPSFREFDSGSQ